MYTYTDLLNVCGVLTKDTSLATQAYFKLWINDTQKKVCKLMKGASFLEDEWVADSVASQEPYRLPHNYGKAIDVWYINGTTKYQPKLVESSEDWTYKSALSTTSDYPDYFHIFGDHIFFYPAFTTANLNIHLRYKKSIKELGIADYSTGTVTVSNNSALVTGTGTAWTSLMVGRYLRFDDDGSWYEIYNVGSSTAITLVKTYEGNAVTNGTYKIGNISVIPDEFQDILWQRPVAIYLMSKGEETRSNFYMGLYREGVNLLISEYQSKTTNQVFTKTETERKNPNDYPTGLS
jgi:hypothetical protein